MQNQSKRKTTFDTQLKTALTQVGRICLIIIRHFFLLMIKYFFLMTSVLDQVVILYGEIRFWSRLETVKVKIR